MFHPNPELPDQKEDVLSDIQIPPEKPTAPSGEQRVFNRLSTRELNPSAIAGLMGSIDIESGGTFAFDRQEDLYEHGDQKGDVISHNSHSIFDSFISLSLV